MKTFTIIIISLSILLISLFILVKNYEKQAIASSLIKIQINKENLKPCCTYNYNGEEKTCYILKRYSCDLCKDKCK
jgi:hypothetical protein